MTSFGQEWLTVNHTNPNITFSTLYPGNVRYDATALTPPVQLECCCAALRCMHCIACAALLALHCCCTALHA